MAGKKKVKATKIKKKKWVSIIAPKLFNNTLLGETHVGEDDDLTKKSVTLNLGTVTSDMRKQGYLVRFDVTKVVEGKAQTAVVAVTMTPSSMKRLVRRGRSKVEDSFLSKLKTGQIVRIKPVIVTINLCSNATKTSIRLALREKLRTMLASMSMDQFVAEVIGNKLQKTLKDVAGKSHPVRTADIKAVILLPKSKEGLADMPEEEQTQEEAPATEEVKEKPKRKKAEAKTDDESDAAKEE